MRHLGLWLRDGDRGVAAVAYREPDTAAAARRRLRPAGRKVRTHRLVRRESARQTVFELIAAVEATGDGVLHVTGWEEAFGGPDLPERVYDLNFLRESVVEHPATQVWWMPVPFRDAFMLRAPDTWSVVKLRMFLADEGEYVRVSENVAHRLLIDPKPGAEDTFPARALSRIHTFTAPFSPIDDDDLRSMAVLTNLRSLDLAHTFVTNISCLSRLRHLESLNLVGTRVSDVSPLAHLSSLNELGLRSTRVVDVASLAKLSKLRRLYLEGTGVSDISPLAALPSLVRLDIQGCPLTDAQVRAFEEALPTCAVFRYDNLPPDSTP